MIASKLEIFSMHFCTGCIIPSSFEAEMYSRKVEKAHKFSGDIILILIKLSFVDDDLFCLPKERKWKNETAKKRFSVYTTQKKKT